MLLSEKEIQARVDATLRGDEAAVEVPSGMSRRDFVRIGGTLTAAAAISTTACMPPAESSIPFNDRPEGLRTLGKPKLYATVLGGAPVRVKTREGRPILVEPPTDEDRLAHRDLTIRTHGALLDLYDPDRADKPLSVRRGDGPAIPSDWKLITREVASRLAKKTGDAVLLTGPVTGPATRAAIAAMTEAFGLRHVTYRSIPEDAGRRAWMRAYGTSNPPRPRLDRAAFILGLGTEFVDRPGDGLERDFAVGREPDRDGGMSRFVQLEGRLSLTGTLADERLRVRDSQLAQVALGLAHELIVARKVGPLAGDAAAEAALAPYALASVAQATDLPEAKLRGVVDALVAHKEHAVVLAGGSASTTAAGDALEVAAILLNASLESYAHDVFEPLEAPVGEDGDLAAFQALAQEMQAGKVKTLIVAGTNPVYDAPAGIDFGAAMKKVDFVLALADRIDETAAQADYLATTSHPLEAWGDWDLGGGILAVQQPVIRPLYDTQGLLDILVAIGVEAKAGASFAEAVAASTKGAADDPGLAYHFIRAHWLASFGLSPAAWDDILRTGHLARPTTVTQATVPVLRPDALTVLASANAPTSPLELQLYPHFALGDGSTGNNGWLHELPDPVTRIAWGGAVSIAPRRFDTMGLQNGDLVAITVGQETLRLPAYRHAGMHEDQVALPLGLGRSRCGVVGNDIGPSLFGHVQLEGGRLVRSGLAVTIEKTDGHDELAITQGAEVIDREQRPLVPLTTLTEYKKNPSAGTEQTEGGPSIWPEHEYETQRWGMSIDLQKCTGCAKCTLSCQAENNIPVVGKKGIIDGREMSWIRIDRYYDAPKKEGGYDDKVWDGPLAVVEEPVTVFEPMLCQHCENAPCETVCPFNATMHSEDGLNQQIYNRCVGTRYCANNCPFKVRRYNWFEYSASKAHGFFSLIFPELNRRADLNNRGNLAMKNNPEVTVRSRGVMEKCSFCVQRIREARAEAIREGHKGKLADGAVTTACMDACPTGAITFGDMNDPKSQVSAKVKDPRAMRLLDSLGVKPSISYLSKVRNDNA